MVKKQEEVRGWVDEILEKCFGWGNSTAKHVGGSSK